MPLLRLPWRTGFRQSLLDIMDIESQAEERTGVSALPRRIPAIVRDYVSLTKPRVVVLLLWTTAVSMFVAGSPTFLVVAATMIGGFLAAGGAGAINHFLDRDIDGRMQRTAHRPLPSGRMHPAAALWFGIALAALSFSVFAVLVNVLAGVLSIIGLLYYTLVYTVWLKRVTPQNIVIGGAAGAVPTLVGWAAATGSLDIGALYLFAIVFYWTPPHFWALSLLMKDDYEKGGIPMLPVVRGESETRRQIYLYTWLLAAVTVLPFAGQLFGVFYLVSSLLLNSVFLLLATSLIRKPGNRSALRLYLYSLLYLALLFSAMLVDKVVG